MQTHDLEPCRLRNRDGSERGTCDCQRPSDCPNPPFPHLIEINLDEIKPEFIAGEVKTTVKNDWD